MAKGKTTKKKSTAKAVKAVTAYKGTPKKGSAVNKKTDKE